MCHGCSFDKLLKGDDGAFAMNLSHRLLCWRVVGNLDKARFALLMDACFETVHNKCIPDAVGQLLGETNFNDRKTALKEC